MIFAPRRRGAPPRVAGGGGPGAQPPENFGLFYFLEHVFTIEFTYFLAIYDCYKMTILGYLFRLAIGDSIVNGENSILKTEIVN